MGSSSSPQIALAVASHRRPDALAILLRSLERQTLSRSRYEVAVVVDGRDDLAAEYARVLEHARDERRLPLAFVFQDRNRGPAAARDRAIRALTRAPLVCVSDDDMELAPGYLAAHLTALERGGEGTVVIGNVVPEEGWQRQPLYEAVRTHAMLVLHKGLREGTRRAQGAVLVTQNISFWRSNYQQVGGFDLSLRLGEDTELGWRLERDGARFVFEPEASAIHRSRVGSYEAWLERQFQYGRNAVYIHTKLGGDPRSHPLRNLVNGNRLKAAAVRRPVLVQRIRPRGHRRAARRRRFAAACRPPRSRRGHAQGHRGAGLPPGCEGRARVLDGRASQRPRVPRGGRPAARSHVSQRTLS